MQVPLRMIVEANAEVLGLNQAAAEASACARAATAAAGEALVAHTACVEGGRGQACQAVLSSIGRALAADHTQQVRCMPCNPCIAPYNPARTGSAT